MVFVNKLARIHYYEDTNVRVSTVYQNYLLLAIAFIT